MQGGSKYSVRLAWQSATVMTCYAPTRSTCLTVTPVSLLREAGTKGGRVVQVRAQFFRVDHGSSASDG